MRSVRSMAGFSLLEASIVITIIAVIVGITLKTGMGVTETSRRVQTEKKLDQIEQALMAFRTTNNRLPCPEVVERTCNAVDSIRLKQ